MSARNYLESQVQIRKRFENNAVVVDHHSPVVRLLSCSDIRSANTSM